MQARAAHKQGPLGILNEAPFLNEWQIRKKEQNYVINLDV